LSGRCQLRQVRAGQIGYRRFCGPLAASITGRAFHLHDQSYARGVVPLGTWGQFHSIRLINRQAGEVFHRPAAGT
jgi:hypothetical protein